MERLLTRRLRKLKMKDSKIKIYAKALAEVILGKKIEDKKIVDNFVSILVKTGQENKAKEILGLAENILLKKQGNKRVVFEVARRLSFENRDLLKQFVKQGDVVQEKINYELIAGVKVVVDGKKQLDNSMINKINNLL